MNITIDFKKGNDDNIDNNFKTITRAMDYFKFAFYDYPYFGDRLNFKGYNETKNL